jgi:predicted histidine transporter YuiF (NhaC family)
MTEEPQEKPKSRKTEAAGMMIPAGLFIGMGIGWAFDYMVQGMFIGLGAGFLAFGLVILLKRD